MAAQPANPTHDVANPMSGAFRIEEPPPLVSRALSKSTITVVETEFRDRNFGMTEAMPWDDAYIVSLGLVDCHDAHFFIDGRKYRSDNWVAGAFGLIDLRRNPMAEVRDPHHSIQFYLPRSALNGLCEELHAPKLGDLRDGDPGRGIVDDVVFNLLSCLRPALAQPAEVNALFVDHIALAVTAHIAGTYGGLQPLKRLCRGGLTPWQERRAKEAIAASLSSELSMDDLAAQCGLSRSYFARAFRQTTGKAPHQWLIERRVEAAKQMLSNASLPLTGIALECGFADQAHFTRIFSRLTGQSPGAWRRQHRSS